MASLQGLPTEILDTVLEDLHQSGSLTSLTTIARVSKSFTKPALYKLYSDISLNFSAAEIIWTSRIISILFSEETGSEYQRHVRRIVVTAGDSLDEKNHLARCHPLLADLVRLLPSLRLFSWHATQSIPVSVLQALRCKPSLHVLDLQFYDRTNAESRDKVLANLMPNTKLKSALLELSLNDLQNDEIDLLDMNLVLEKMPIKACQLQTLVLRVSDSLPIDVTLPLPPISWELSHRHNLQSVEDLRIIGPRMGTDIGIFGRITCANLRTLELWNCGDCTELFHSLAEDHSDLKIRTFKIRESQADINANWLNSNDGIEACHGFISSLDGLEELALEGYESTKMECITCHSRTLKKLTWTVRWLSCTEKANALATIRDGCSSLRSLRINEPRARLHRGEAIPAVIRTFTTLRELTVIIEPLPLWYQPEFTYTDTDVHDMSFCFTSEHLRHVEITDQVHDPTEMTPFADVQYDAEIRARARNCSIHWRAEVVEWDEWKSKLVVTDMLLSPDCWQERRITRLARSLGCDYEERGTAGSPQRVRRQDWVAGLYEEADLRRQEARAAIDGYGLDLNNSSLDTLGHGDIEEL